MTDKVAVIIINYNSWQHTINCLDSICRVVGSSRHFKIFLVDNHSTDDSREKIDEFLSTDNHLDLEFIKSPENRGFSGGNNLGVKRALAEGFAFIMLLNNDTLIEKDIFQTAGRFFQRHPECTVIAANTRRPEGTRELNCTRAKPTFWQLLFLYHTPFWNRRWFPGFRDHYMLDRDPGAPFRVYAGSGACLVFRREYFETTGLFDENTFLFAEEFIIGETCAKHGFSTYYVPQMTLTHLGGQSTKAIRASSFIEFCKSEKYLCQHYYDYDLFRLCLLFSVRFAKYSYRCLAKKDYRQNLRRFFAIYGLSPSDDLKP